MNEVADSELERFRSCGDPVLDEPLSEVQPSEVGRLLGLVFRTSDLPRDEAQLSRLYDLIPSYPVEDETRVARGQDLFRLYGPEVLLVLGCYALPSAYAGADGVQVIYRARRLRDNTERRLTETAQMLINVMVPGGLVPGGIGDRSAKKVRLMHALVRRHIQASERDWSERWGLPINQEDLAGTLLTFSVLVLDGLTKMGVELSSAEIDDYMTVWAHLGRVLGVDEELICRDQASGQVLARRIGRRQFKPSPEGRELLKGLIEVNEGMFPLKGYAVSLMNFFLDDSVFGVNLAEVLDVPKPNWTRHLLRLRALQKRTYFNLLDRVPGARRRRRAFGGHFVQRLLLRRRSPDGAPFDVPPEMAKHWLSSL